MRHRPKILLFHQSRINIGGKGLSPLRYTFTEAFLWKHCKQGILSCLIPHKILHISIILTVAAHRHGTLFIKIDLKSIVKIKTIGNKHQFRKTGYGRNVVDALGVGTRPPKSQEKQDKQQKLRAFFHRDEN